MKNPAKAGFFYGVKKNTLGSLEVMLVCFSDT